MTSAQEETPSSSRSCCERICNNWVKTGLAFFVFAATNIGLNEFNPWALKSGQFPGFKYPVFYGMWHMLISSIAAYLLMLTVARPPTGMPSFKQLCENPALVAIAMCGALNVSLNNVSLMYVSLFVNQVIKASQPMPTVVFEMIIAKKTFGWAIIASTVMVCVGAGLAPYYQIVHDHKPSTTLGIVAVTIATLVTALKPVLAMVMMAGSDSKPKLSPTLVMFYDASLSFVFMASYWLVSPERHPSIMYLANTPNRTEEPWLEGYDTTSVGIEIIAIGSAMAFTFNLSTYYYVMLTSALTSTIGSLGVKITLLLVSAMQAGVRDPVSLTGIAIVALSISSYAYFSYQAKVAAAAAAAAKLSADGAPKATEKTPLKQPLVPSEAKTTQ